MLVCQRTAVRIDRVDTDDIVGLPRTDQVTPDRIEREGTRRSFYVEPCDAREQPRPRLGAKRRNCVRVAHAGVDEAAIGGDVQIGCPGVAGESCWR